MDILAQIFETEWQEIERKINLVSSAVETIHIDGSDGTLLPHASFLQFEQFKKYTDGQSGRKLMFEAHLLVYKPELYLPSLVAGGFRRVYTHIEAHDPRLFLEKAKYEEIEVGLAINGLDDVSHLDPFIEEIDSVLVLSSDLVAPTRQTGLEKRQTDEEEFVPEALDTIRLLHEHYPDLPIAVDGGIHVLNAHLVRDAGATRIISSAFFQEGTDIQHTLQQLQGV